ncbi:MAG: transketolase [Clostridia bacterium]
MNTLERSNEIRQLTLRCMASIGQGHVGGSLSIADVLAVLYSKHMRIDPKNPKLEGRDRLVLSKGHAGPALYATLASFGYFPKSELDTLNKLGTKLPSHCNMVLTTGVDMTAGSLGQGMSAAVGMAIGSVIKKDDATIYCIVGDGELQEGQNWEAAMYAGNRHLGNLIVFVDNNKMQIDGMTSDISNIEDIVAKFKSFGFHTQRISGSNHQAIDEAIIEAKKQLDKPSVIVMDTIKGAGVSFYEAMGSGNHNCAVTAQQLQDATQELSKGAK